MVEWQTPRTQNPLPAWRKSSNLFIRTRLFHTCLLMESRHCGGMVELADTLDLGSSASRRKSSNLFTSTVSLHTMAQQTFKEEGRSVKPMVNPRQERYLDTPPIIMQTFVCLIINGALTQLVEQRTLNPNVKGSYPLSPTKMYYTYQLVECPFNSAERVNAF